MAMTKTTMKIMNGLINQGMTIVKENKTNLSVVRQLQVSGVAKLFHDGSDFWVVACFRDGKNLASKAAETMQEVHVFEDSTHVFA